jgi:hypothetical protein
MQGRLMVVHELRSCDRSTVDSRGGMRSHRSVRGSLRRLAVALLIALLAWPLPVAVESAAAREQPAPSADTDGMAPTPAHPSAVELAMAPTADAPPSASVAGRVLVSFRPLVCRAITERPFRLFVAVRSAPTVLRV